jgi:hypothetical protein
MPRRLLLLVSINVVALLAGACGTSGPASAPSAAGLTSPTASASPVPLPTPPPTAPPSVFKSTIYDYSIALPAGWIAIPATAAWDGKEMSHDAAYVDQFQFPNGAVTGAYYVIPSADRLAAFGAEDRA